MDHENLSKPSKVIVVASAACYVVTVGICFYLNIVAAPMIAMALLWTFVDAMFLAIFGVFGTGALVMGIEALVHILAEGKLQKEDEEVGIDELNTAVAQ